MAPVFKRVFRTKAVVVVVVVETSGPITTMGIMG
jgi:hypothetical protein